MTARRLVTAACALATAVCAAAAATPAQARILCDKGFQIINGQPHATPYCEDAYLGAVARTYGIKVSDAAIRNSPGTKRDVCRAIGHDGRIQHVCATVIDRGGQRPWR